ncbi:hypothetical protein QR98_0014270 [Sarcoptes scabiei]|uniref:Uncharacterized protein n=1 Tax=Sarcoptes scabiei TaxID=52283 RepID=A0A131ZWX7_SARSC|nr:hypothetical protein QR98_0014270 [Sarcoptes scabiei]
MIDSEELRRNISQQKSNLFEIIDRELIANTLKLYLLRSKLESYRQSKLDKILKPIENDRKRLEIATKSIQVSPQTLMNDVSIQVNQSDDLPIMKYNENSKQKLSSSSFKIPEQDFRADFDELRRLIEDERKILNSQNCLDHNANAFQRLNDSRTALKNCCKKSSMNYINRERQYFERINKLKNKTIEHQNHIEDFEAISNNIDGNADDDDDERSRSVNGGKKIFRSVAVETTFTDDLDLIVPDETVYLKLPNTLKKAQQKRSFEKNKKTIAIAKLQDLENKLQNALKIIEEDPIMEMESFRAVDNRRSNGDIDLDLDHPQDRSNDCVRSSKITNSFRNSFDENNISLPTSTFINQTCISEMTSFIENQFDLDHNLFWNEVLQSAGISSTGTKII